MTPRPAGHHTVQCVCGRQLSTCRCIKSPTHPEYVQTPCQHDGNPPPYQLYEIDRSRPPSIVHGVWQTFLRGPLVEDQGSGGAW